MNGAAEFFHMGGYAFYIWSSYSVAALVLLGLFVWSRISLRNAEKREAQLGLGRRERRRARQEPST